MHVMHGSKLSLRRNLTGACVLALASLTAQPAHARMWMMVFAEGVPPQRSVYYANFDDIMDRSSPEEFMAALQKFGDSAKAEASASVMQIRATQVQESASAPYSTTFALEFRCGSGQMRITEHTAWFRDNGRSESRELTDWQSISQPWHEQSRMLACDQAKWKAALEKDMKRGNSQDSLNQLGLVLVGDHVLNTSLSDLTWTTLWRDGKEPAYTTNKSPAELEKLRQQTIAQGDETIKRLNKMGQGVRQDLEENDKESKFMTEIDRNFAKNTYHAVFRNLMLSQKGWTEAELIEAWGYPDEQRQVNGAVLLVYYNENDERRTIVTSPEGDAITLGDMRTCELMLVMREGGKKPGPRLVDYQMDGSNCNTATLTRSVPGR